jgi:hypothetical protein
MPYEEYYNPTDNEIFNEPSGKTVADELKKLDKQYQKYVKPLFKTWRDGKFYKKPTIECYGSGQIGSQIRNAVTGQYYPYRVGEMDESCLFKVIDAVGREGRSDPLMLYYDSPEQYENHQFVTVSQSIKENWHKRVAH